jgi:hypothetical protein
LTACGGDGDSTNAASYDFTVTAIDGYLANAIVTATCGNQTFTGVTNASGVAQIDTNGIASTNCAIAITANPDGSTTDIDTDDKYAANSLYLLSPAGQSGNLVATPFTTMVALLLESSSGQRGPRLRHRLRDYNKALMEALLVRVVGELTHGQRLELGAF